MDLGKLKFVCFNLINLPLITPLDTNPEEEPICITNIVRSNIIFFCFVFILVVCESTCVTPDGISGSCIELKNCKYLQKDLKKDPSFIINSRCGPNNSEELAKSFVCCNLLPSPNPKDRECGNTFQGKLLFLKIKHRLYIDVSLECFETSACNL